jgi:hypothetical protein
MIEKPTRGSPVDTILIAASVIFPLDFVLLTFIVISQHRANGFILLDSQFAFVFTDTVSFALLVSRPGFVGSALYLCSDLRRQKTCHSAARHATSMHVSFIACFRYAMANCISSSSGIFLVVCCY